MIRSLSLALACALAAPGAVLAAPVATPFGAAIADAAPKAAPLKGTRSKASAQKPAKLADRVLIAKAEVLLDRAHISPGEIDGLDGDNFHAAVRAFQEVRGLPTTGELDAPTWAALTQDSAPVLKPYTVTLSDAAGPFTRAIPAGLQAMARLTGLSYANAQSALAEKFHMSPALLRELNPRADFAKAGTELTVASVSEMALRPGAHTLEVAPPPPPPKGASEEPEVSVVVDKAARNVRVYDHEGRFVAFYPATVGSEEKPAPSGSFKVKGVAWNPRYEYDPKFAWKGVTAKRAFTVAPGPNNPVGLVWIALDNPSYGIHGTPAPADIGKTQSHGCVRLTNWDAADLAARVRPGVVVRFDDESAPIAPPPQPAVSEMQTIEPRGTLP